MPLLEFTLAELARVESMPPPDYLQRRLRILVVDDESSIREVVATTLREEGHFVETAVDGLDGLEHFRRGAWDVVLTDRAMPGLSGEQLAAEIKIAAPYLPVIMLSGFSPSQSGSVGQPLAADMLISKPFRLETIRAAVIEAAQMYSGVSERSDEDEQAVG